MPSGGSAWQLLGGNTSGGLGANRMRSDYGRQCQFRADSAGDNWREIALQSGQDWDGQIGVQAVGRDQPDAAFAAQIYQPLAAILYAFAGGRSHVHGEAAKGEGNIARKLNAGDYRLQVAHIVLGKDLIKVLAQHRVALGNGLEGSENASVAGEQGKQLVDIASVDVSEVLLSKDGYGSLRIGCRFGCGCDQVSPRMRGASRRTRGGMQEESSLSGTACLRNVDSFLRIEGPLWEKTGARVGHPAEKHRFCVPWAQRTKARPRNTE